MNWRKTRQNLTDSKKGNGMSVVEDQYPSQTAMYGAKLLDLLSTFNSGRGGAKREASRLCGLSERSFERLISGDTKSPSERILFRVRDAYVRSCQRAAMRLEEDIKTEMARSKDASVFEDLADQVSVLSDQIKQAKEREIR